MYVCKCVSDLCVCTWTLKVCLYAGFLPTDWIQGFDKGSKLLIFMFFRANFAVIICSYLKCLIISQQMNHQTLPPFLMPVPLKASPILTVMICRATGIHDLISEVVLTARDVESFKDLFAPAGMIQE